MTTTPSTSNSFLAIQENDPFLRLFPHRFDYIYAPLPLPGDRPQWFTETRHPLSDRLILQGGQLYGVRFGKTTRYALLDIDIHSPYHPKQDSLAIPNLMGALEVLGLCRYMRVRSSYSGGIHLYIPFNQAQSTNIVALAITTALERAGFKPAPGQLEVFPDAKPYLPHKTRKRFAAHRLPLQAGSYLLTEDWEPMFSSPKTFVEQWRHCCENNTISRKGLQQAMKTYRRTQYPVTTSASKFLNDLMTEIEQGWTGSGQTNHLLGRIAMREYIFGNLLYGTFLKGEDLVQQIVKTATALPGYDSWCQHRHEIRERAEEWARCVESSHYFPYGNRSKKRTSASLTAPPEPKNQQKDNQARAQKARETLQQKVLILLKASIFPAGITERFKALVRYGFSGNTLYRNTDLWHPRHMTLEALSTPASPEPVENVAATKIAGAASREDAAPPHGSLLQGDARNKPPDKGLSAFKLDFLEAARNKAMGVLQFLQGGEPTEYQKAQEKNRRIKQEQHLRRHIEQMRQWWASGDPILMAEAQIFARKYPEILNPDPDP